MKLEEWKDIDGYEGYYQISTFGNVRSIRSNRNLSLKDRLGYKCVNLSVNGKARTFSVHRLVAKAFIPNYQNKPTVNHINEDKSDNRVDNLEWASSKEQNNHGTRIQRAVKHTDYKARKIDYSAVASKHDYKALGESLSKRISQYTMSGIYINTFKSLHLASKATGVSIFHISLCINGHRKTAGGFIWKLAE